MSNKIRTVAVVAAALVGGALLFVFFAAKDHNATPIKDPDECAVACVDGTCCPEKYECSDPAKGFLEMCPRGYCCPAGHEDWRESLALYCASEGGAACDGGAFSMTRNVEVVRATPRRK